MPPARPIGRPRTTDLREVVNAILYMASTGCQWRMLPKDLPPPSTVQRYFYDWRDSGLWRGISNHLVMASARAGGPRGEPDGGRDRQPERENHREWRGLRLRRRQEDQGPQAPHRHRHARPDGRTGRSRRRCPGPRRRARGAAIHPRPLALAAPRLRRWRLCRPETRRRHARLRRLDDRDHQALRHRQRASRSCHADGSSSAPSRGSGDAADWPRTGRNPSPPPRHGSSSPISAC